MMPLLWVGVRMIDFAVIPRSHNYWVYEMRGSGEHRPVACFCCEEEAIERLRQLRAEQDAHERRRIARESSRFYRPSDRSDWAARHSGGA
jgi:hypothetical protein